MGPGESSTIVPIDWCREAHTRDGIAYRIRPIAECDLERERTFIAGLSTESRYKRFLNDFREPPPALVNQFVHVNYRDSMAFVATTGAADAESFLGIGRYALDTSCDRTEFAVSVADDWQGRGIGAALVSVLFEYARMQGIQRLVGWVLATNEPMLRLARSFHMRQRSVPWDPALVEVEVEVQLDAAPHS